MNAIEKMTAWGDSHHAGWLDFFRVILGGFLFYKGIEFGRDPHEINELVQAGGFTLWSWFLVHYIPLMQLTCGVMIAFGFKTRWAAAFMLPILAGAVVLNIMASDSFPSYSNGGISIITLIMLIGFLVYGSGPYSVDQYFKTNEET